MGIVPQFYDEISKVRKSEFGDTPISVAILGDCTFHMPWRTGDNRKDLEKFALQLNLSRVETFDLFGNPTIKADLHEPIAREYHGQFDFVIDSGTMYCCFDMVAVWKNLLQMLKPDGVVFHQAGLTGYIGRGYYNIHPMAFRDFYVQNGFSILFMKTLIRNFHENRSFSRRVLKKLFGYKNEPHQIGVNDTYLNAATWHSLHFSEQTNISAKILPVDADILCCARRKEVKPFTLAVPSYYA